MKSICAERSWEFPWEQEYEEYLESQEDCEDEDYEDSQDDDSDETTAELIEEAILDISKNNDIVLQDRSLGKISSERLN